METSTPAKKETFLKKHMANISNFVKKYKIVLICISVALVLCLAVIATNLAIRSNQAQNLQQEQIGRCYKEKSYDSWSGQSITIYYFTEDGLDEVEVRYGYSDWERVENIYGSLDGNVISQVCPFKVSFSGEPYLFGNRLIKLNENNEIIECQGRAWELISLEDALEFEKESRELWAQSKCEHEYGELKLTEKATCSQKGKETKTCNKCGYVWVNEIDKLPHEYVNKICSVCGEKKIAEKSDIEANTWYTYQDVLHFQNIKLYSAFSVSNGKGMMVSYYFVCQHCHSVDDAMKMNVPEFNYPISKMFTCDECGKFTTVKIELG